MSEQQTLDELEGAEEDLLSLGPNVLHLPREWEQTEFGSVFSSQRGVNYSSDNYVSEGEGMIFFTLNAISPGGGLKKGSLKYYDDNISEERMVEEGDILMANTDLNQDGEIIGYPVRVPSFESGEKMCFSHHLLKIHPKKEVYNSHFLESLLSAKYIHDRMIAFSCGSTVLNLNTDLLDSLELPVPPLSEQRKIATVLYTVDQAIKKTSELIEQLGRVKQGVRQNILTSGITEDGKVRASPESEPEKYIDARQWTVPNSWELKELSDICSIQVGYTFKSDWYQEEGNVRVLRGANVGYGKPDWSETYYLEPERVSEYEEYLLDEGDLVIGMDRPYTNSGFKISRLSETDVPSLLVQRVGRFVPEGCDPDYLHVVLSDWRYQKQVLRRAQGMDIPHISQTDILSPKIPLPPLEEQKRIADRYSSILERIDCEKSLLREYKTLKQGLMQDILSGSVRTTDTNIEVPEEIAQYG